MTRLDKIAPYYSATAGRTLLTYQLVCR